MSDNTIYLRKADWNDVEFLLELRNDKEVRANSFQTDFVKKDQHYDWYKRRLNDRKTRIYILQKGLEKIGQVRVDQKMSEFMISYAICEKERGKGYAKQMLKLLEDKMKSASYGEEMYLSGEVKENNVASQKVFLTLGYEQEKIPIGYCYRKKIK